jgi:hypothetical protein
MDRFNYNAPESMWGQAIKYTYTKEDGTMWVGNEEYETQVNFCPMTGKPAEKQMTGTEKQLSNSTNYTFYE